MNNLDVIIDVDISGRGPFVTMIEFGRSSYWTADRRYRRSVFPVVLLLVLVDLRFVRRGFGQSCVRQEMFVNTIVSIYEKILLNYLKFN